VLVNGRWSDDEKLYDATKVEMPDDDLVVQILARLDGPSYRKALYQDARVSFLLTSNFQSNSHASIFHILPKCLFESQSMSISSSRLISPGIKASEISSPRKQ